MDRTKLLQNPLPIDRVAARVLRGKGEHWEPTGNPMKRGPGDNLIGPTPGKAMPATATDYTGERRGRLVAFRYLDGKRWVMRCDCGAFEHRDIKKWIDRVLLDECHRCNDARYAKTGHWYSCKRSNVAVGQLRLGA